MPPKSKEAKQGLVFAEIPGEMPVTTPWPFLSPFEVAKFVTNKTLKGIYTDEGKCDSQPPFFQPRFEWPDPETSSLTDAQSLSPTEAMKELGEVPRAPQWKDATWMRNQYLARAPSWSQHLTDIRNALVEIDQKKILSLTGMMSLLTVMLYGLEGVAAKIPIPLRICLVKQGNSMIPAFFRSHQTERRYIPGTLLVYGDHSGGLTFPEWTWSNFAGRRLVVGSFQFYDGKSDTAIHWATFVFDRQTGTLYYLDTLSSGRKERFKAACSSIQVFWKMNGLPYPFVAFDVDLAEQDKPESSGVLSLFTLWLMIRGLVGCDIRPTELSEISVLSGSPSPASLSYMNSKLELLVPTWNLWESVEASVDQAHTMLAAICCNELGIRDGKILRDGDAQPLYGANQYRYNLFTISGDQHPYKISSSFSALGGYLPIEIWPIPKLPEKWKRVFKTPAEGDDDSFHVPFAYKQAVPTPTPDRLPPPQFHFRVPIPGNGHSQMRPGLAYVPGGPRFDLRSRRS